MIERTRKEAVVFCVIVISQYLSVRENNGKRQS
jgi:hypothetical protein